MWSGFETAPTVAMQPSRTMRSSPEFETDLGVAG